MIHKLPDFLSNKQTCCCTRCCQDDLDRRNQDVEDLELNWEIPQCGGINDRIVWILDPSERPSLNYDAARDFLDIAIHCHFDKC